MSKKELWLRLKHYHFDDLVPAHMMDHVSAVFSGTDASTKAFADKISRKLHWSPAFALRAITEYKKFVYLGSVGPANVTPSKFIDMVWHEHLLFSRAYRVFCRDVIGRDFDHNPELVPVEKQTDVFETQYLATLDAYRAEFNTEPPADIWDVAKFKRRPPKSDRRTSTSTPDYWSDSTPLHQYFGASGESGTSTEATPEFGGGGGFSGGGAGRSWGSDDAAAHSHSHADSTSHSDASDSGSGGDTGGSSCSSSCGGGGE